MTKTYFHTISLLFVMYICGNNAQPNDPFTPGEYVQCKYLRRGIFDCKGINFENADETADIVGTMDFYLHIGISILLLIVAGLASGLTMGLMSLDVRNLNMLRRSKENIKEAIYAKRVYPLVKRHHLLLVTLLLVFVAALEAIPIFLVKLVPNPYVTLGISVPFVLFFGEIIPGAICTRWSLTISYYFAWIVWALIVIFCPIAWPISKILDIILGSEDGTFYRRDELKDLVQVATYGNVATKDGEFIESAQTTLTQDEVKVIVGALSLKEKKVGEAMTTLDEVFMLSDEQILGPELLEEITEHGHSRVPVYHGRRDFIIGMILTTHLIRINPNSNTKVEDIELLQIPRVSEEMSCYKILDQFKTGKSQMALVLDKKDNLTPRGIITLEDVFEELIGSDIYDEKDLMRQQRAQAKDMIAPAAPKLNESTAATTLREFIMKRSSSVRDSLDESHHWHSAMPPIPHSESSPLLATQSTSAGRTSFGLGGLPRNKK